MATRYILYKELTFGAFLATVVAVAPKYLMKLRLGIGTCSPDCMLSYNCPGIWIYMFSAVMLLVSLLFSRCRRWHVAILLIWLAINFYKFLWVIHSQECNWEILREFSLLSAPVVSLVIFFVLSCSTAYLWIKLSRDL